MVPACSCDTLTNELPHRNAMLRTQDMTLHPVTVYRHKDDLLLCYTLMWNVTLEYTATHFTVLEIHPWSTHNRLLFPPIVRWLVGWLCFTSHRQRRMWSSVLTPFPPGIEQWAVAWQSMTLPLRHTTASDC